MSEDRSPDSGVEFRAVAQYDMVKQNTFNLYVECERHLRECLYDGHSERELSYEDRFVGSVLTLYFDLMAKGDYVREIKHVDAKGKEYHFEDMLGYLRNPKALAWFEALEYFILIRKFLEKQGVLFVETPRYKPQEMILYGLEKRQ